MASQDARDSLDVLQDMFNDVLIHTGKALRASRNSSGNNGQGQSPVQFKMPETMRAFHSALDDLENEIIRAKSVMQRDMARMQATRNLAARPHPVEAQSKPPMVIDLDSPPRGNGEPYVTDQRTETKPIAPFPDMGMDVSAPVPSDDDPAVTSPTPQAVAQGDIKPEPQTSTPTALAPPSADKAGSVSKPNDALPGEASTEAPNPELTFTDMEFTLAPAETGGQGDLDTQDQSFDLANFATAEGGNNSMTLDGLLPPASTEQPNEDPLAAPDMTAGNQGQADTTANQLNEPAAFDALNMDNMDFGAADGTDFDFSMDDGNSFNDLMNSHEQNFDTSMEHGQFDADFFGLDKPDGT